MSDQKDPQPFAWATLLVVLGGTFVTILDFFIVNVAVPDTQRDLSAGPAAVQLIVGGYGLALAVGLVTGGRLGDLYGRRRLFMLGLSLFTLMSFGCALAPSATALVCLRVAQGAAAALVVPQTLGILSSAFDGAHRQRAFTAYGFTLGIAGVLGQVIGGALLRWDPAGLGWRSIFVLNLPIGTVAVLAARRHVPESRGGSARPDLPGTLLLTDALVALVLPLVVGRQQGWPAWTVLSFALSPVFLAAFVGAELRGKRSGRAPLVDPEMFRDSAFRAGLGVALTFCVAQASFFFVLALYLQQGRGMSPLGSGGLVAVLGAGFFAAMIVSEKVATALGRQGLAVGALITAAGYGCLAVVVEHVGVDGSVLPLLPGLLVAGFGMGLVLAPLSGTVLAKVSPAHAGTASGVLSTALELGGALGVAIFGAVFFGHGGGDAGSAGNAVAFRDCLVAMAAVVAAAAGLVQLLPGEGSRRRNTIPRVATAQAGSRAE